MCGLCGVAMPRGRPVDDAARRALERMTRSLARRGPDDEAVWVDPEAGVGLGFRRLAILDVSPAGRQPMVSASGRSVLAFNGEIYNFQELRAELEGQGVVFRSSGDAEVLLEALEAWGLEALERLVGMFALAWWRRDQRRLIVARDPFGIKPLWLLEPPGGGLAFASQLDSLWHAPLEPPGSPRLDVLRLYLELSYVPAPHGPVEHVRQLEPGAWLELGADGATRSGRSWTPPSIDEALAGVEIERRERALERLDASLERAVARHRLSDVPLGVFLSGGVDSPLVAAIARAQAAGPLDAFTLGNPGWGQDETAAAARRAQALDLRHHVERLTLDDQAALDRSFDAVRAAQHEPFADFSMLPTLLLSRFARERVTVALSGDGADEVFFGYERPRSLLRDGHLFRWPRPLRLALYALGRAGLGPPRSDVVVHRDPSAYYRAVNSRFAAADLARVAPGLGAVSAPAPFARDDSTGGDPRRLAALARRAEMAGQLQRCLKKVDMASMHWGLEVRVPFLDRELVEESFRIDPLLHLRRGDDPQGPPRGRKELLRALLSRRLGRAGDEEKKLGFSVPLAELLRGPLRPRVEETLLDAPLEPAGVFDRAGVEAFWGEHRRGEADHKWALWALIALQWWLRDVGALERAVGGRG